MGFFGFDSVRDAFDGGGRGGTGSKFSSDDHQTYTRDYEARYGRPDPNARSHSDSGRGDGGNDSFAGAIGTIISGAFSAIGGIVSTIAEGIGGVISGVGGFIGGGIASLGNALGDNFIGNTLAAIGGFISNGSAFLGDTIAGIGEFGGHLISSSGRFAAGVTEGALQALTGDFADGLESLGQAAKALFNDVLVGPAVRGVDDLVVGSTDAPDLSEQIQALSARLASASYLEREAILAEFPEVAKRYIVRDILLSSPTDKAFAFVDKTTGEVVIGIRGTDGTDGWLQGDGLNNVVEFGPGLGSQTAREIADYIDNNYGSGDVKVTVTGHSRGGTLAELVGRYAEPGLVDTVVNVQGPSLIEVIGLYPTPNLVNSALGSLNNKSGPDIYRITSENGSFPQEVLDNFGFGLRPPQDIAIGVAPHSHIAVDNYYRERGIDPFVSPLLLDLNNDGVAIVEISQSTVFTDTNGDGLESRTAWAGAGDGVLFYDADGDATISEAREYIFTEWDPTATSDIDAVRSVFDTNGDGVLDAQDTDWVDFKVLVTQPDGSQVARTLAELGIASIDLTADATQIELPDGSVITGQTTFTRTDGTTGTVADTTLATDVQSYRVEKVESVDGAGTRTLTQTGYNRDGSVAFEYVSITSADGSSIEHSYDDNGDGVVDRLQSIITTTDSLGVETETVTNSRGADAASSILVSRKVTTTSADGNTITIERDSTGGGWFDQIETRTTHADDSLTIITQDLGQDGSVIRSSTEVVSADGLLRNEVIDEDGDGLTDIALDHAINVAADGSRTEAITFRNGDGSIREGVTEAVSANGRNKTILRDLDGDGDTDTEEDLVITVAGDGSTQSVTTIRNQDGSVRNSTTQLQSDDALTKTIETDRDGDGLTDLTSVEDVTIHADESRETLTTVTNGDGSLRAKERVTLGADKVSSETWIDLDKDGVFDAHDLVQSVSVDGSTQERTAQTWARSSDGTVLAQETVVTSEDGLSSNTTSDADGDGLIDTNVAETTVVNGDGSTTETIVVTNRDGSNRSETVTTTSADSLTVTTTADVDGDGDVEDNTTVVRTNNPDGSTTTTTTTRSGDGTLIRETIISESTDRRTVTVSDDANGDGAVDQITTSVQATDGSRTSTTTTFAPDGGVLRASSSAVSADGLTSSTTQDVDADGLDDHTTSASTILNADGSRTTVEETRNQDGSLRASTVSIVSDDGLSTTSENDADGDGAFERETRSLTTLNADGSRTTLAETLSGDGSRLSQTQVTVSDDGLITTQKTDADGNGSFDLTATTTSLLQNDGDTVVTEELRDAVGALRSTSTVITSDDGRSQTSTTDITGDGQTDMFVSRIEADSGVVTTTTSELNADGSLQSRRETVESANGLSMTDQADTDGDGTYELARQTTTVLNADGSRSTTVSQTGQDTTLHSQSVTIVSDDGFSSTETIDLDGDGDTDRSTVTTRDIDQNGGEVVASETRATDNSLLSAETMTTSADKRLIVREVDSDGNGNIDQRTTTTLQDDSERETVTTFHSSGGTEEARRTETVSADGFTRRIETDRNADGTAEHIHSETGGIRADGTTWRSVEHYDGRNIALANEEHEVSGDGLSSRTGLDLDGDDLYEFTTERDTVFEADGDVVTTAITLDETFDVVSEREVTTSGNGLFSRDNVDFDGDGSTDRITETTRGASGGLTEVTNEYGGGFQLNRSTVTTVSEDGWTTTQSVDLDGDGRDDQRMVSGIDDDRTTTTSYEDLSFLGQTEARASVAQTANGMETTATFDHNGDGTTERTHLTSTGFDGSGNAVTTYEETLANGKLIYQEVTTNAANGLSSTTTTDIDGDGVTDGTKTETTTLHSDGSRTIVSESVYADGDLRAKSDISISADGRHTVETHDYDGNGIADKWRETEVRADGETIVTERSFNEAGYENSTFVTTTSSDGLLRTVNRDGVIQTYTKSAVDNGSYTWDNGQTGTAHVFAEHSIDADGVETWTVTQGTATTAVRLDGAAKARLFEEAARIYDTVLDRDIDSVEGELLINFVSGGQLDRAALVSNLLGSGEFVTRYGTLSEAAFTTQLYLNSYGRGPSLAELSDALHELTDSASREDFALILAESAEHLVIGNGHHYTLGLANNQGPGSSVNQGTYATGHFMSSTGYKNGGHFGQSSIENALHITAGYSHITSGHSYRATNNFDVIMNPAQFERNLDRAYVEAQIKSLVDVAYDRDATAQEIAELSSRLLDGTDTPSDVATTLLANDGGIQNVATNSLNSLSGLDLINSAFENGLGRAPTTQERDTWLDHLNDGRVAKEEFLVAISLSIEYLEHGTAAHVAAAVGITTTVDTSNSGTFLSGTAEQDDLRGLDGDDTLDGNGGSDHLHGGLGDDSLIGNEGNDTYYWARGDGNDRIDEGASSSRPEETDRLIFADVASTDVTLTRVGASLQDMLVSISGSAEILQVTHQFGDSYVGKGLELIEFSDGVVWHLDDIHAQARLEGTTSNDLLSGKENFGDNIFGHNGNDTLDGNGGDDHLHGGRGNDTLKGNGGNDSYYWARGDGSDLIDEGSNASLTNEIDRLVLADVTSLEVELLRIGSSLQDMQIVVSGTSETIQITHQFGDSYVGKGIEVIEFSDGAVWNLSDILGAARIDGTSGNNSLVGKNNFRDNLYGLDGNDHLDGNGGDDHLFGGKGDDTLHGNDGSDTYYWSRGDGNDRIDEGANSSTQELDRLIFTDVASGDVSLVRSSASPQNLNITIAGTSEAIQVDDQFADSYVGRGLEYIEFSDGIVWRLADIHANTDLEGTTGNDNLEGKDQYTDNIYGFAGNDTLDGNGGNDNLYGGTGQDTLKGENGSDTYFWSLGDGNDFIDDNGTSFDDVDTLRFQNTVLSNIDLTQVGNDLQVSVLSTGETLNVDDRFASSSNSQGIEVIDFQDGVRVEVLADAVAQANILGTAASQTLSGWGFIDNIYGYDGNDTLDGNGGDDHFHGGAGNDRLIGNDGNDTYYWSRGDGNDRIDEGANASRPEETDTLILADVASSDVQLTRIFGARQDIQITIAGTSETIRIDDQFADSYVGRGIEVISFSDGVTWELQDIYEHTRFEGTTANDSVSMSKDNYRDNIYGYEGNDTLVGKGGDDHLYGGVGNDTLKGGAGNDTYHWARGEGSDRIDGETSSPDETDRLILTDVASTEVELTRILGARQDVLMTIAGTSDTIRVDDQFSDAHVGRGIELIEFSDNVTWTLKDIQEHTRFEGTSANNNVTAASGNYRDNIFGLDGNDTLSGKGGDDHLHGGNGNDTLRGNDGNDTYYWARGEGSDRIDEGSNYSNPEQTDRLILSDVASSEVDLMRLSNATHDMLININGTSEVIRVVYQFADSYIGRGIEAIEFNDGVTWSLEDIHANARIEGTSGSDSLIGKEHFDDNIFGLAGNDTLQGKGGSDRLVGGTGNDNLTGGTGADVFEFGFGDGSDTISDFDTSFDMLRLVATELGFADLQIAQVGTSSMVTYGLDDIALTGVSAVDLTEDIFQFV